MTRVDGAFNISFLSQFSNNPTVDCWEALAQVLTYLDVTRSRAIDSAAAACCS